MSTLTQTIRTEKAEYGFTGVVYSCGMSISASTKRQQAHILPVARPENLDWSKPGP